MIFSKELAAVGFGLWYENRSYVLGNGQESSRSVTHEYSWHVRLSKIASHAQVNRRTQLIVQECRAHELCNIEEEGGVLRLSP
jgi:hypothetical protein